MNWQKVLDAASCDVRRLDYVDRFSSIPVLVKENVSSHSYWVSLYSILIHENLSGDRRLLGPISVHAITHDIVESLTGDLVRTFKYSSDVFKSAVNSAEHNMYSHLPDAIQILNHIWEYEAGQDAKYVKAVVKAADFMSLHQYMIREVARGNEEIRPFFQRMITDLRIEEEKFKTDQDSRIASIAPLFELMASTHVSGQRTA